MRSLQAQAVGRCKPASAERPSPIVVTAPAPRVQCQRGTGKPTLRTLHIAHVSTTATQKTNRASPKEPPPEERVQVDSEKVLPLAPNVSVVRGSCMNKLRMEVEYMLKHGTSDNCYLIQVPGAVALVDIPYEAYADKFVAALSESVSLTSLTHIVITHLDPKSIPTLELLLAAMTTKGNTKPTVVLSNPAQRLLQSTLGDKPERAALLSSIQLSTARSGQQIQLGTNPANVLRVELTPTPRWPDLIVAYYPPSRVLFSSKLFSAHVSPPDGQVEDVGGWERYGEDWKYFFDCMLAPSAIQALSAIDKLDIVPVPLASSASPTQALANKAMLSLIEPIKTEFAWLKALITGKSATPEAPSASGTTTNAFTSSGEPLAVSVCAPMHGPAVRLALGQLLREYRGWINEQIKASDTASVAVLYASAYGNTAALAQAISKGVTKAGVGVQTLNLEVSSLDEVTQVIKKSDGFILGSPTLGGHMPTQVSVALGAIMRESQAKGQPCGVFGSFGWSGEAVDEMESRLKDAGFNFAFKGIRVKFKPTAKDVILCEDSGRDLAMAVKKRARAKKAASAPGLRAQAVANGAQLAAGRLVGSLSVITAKDDDAVAAMLASWVSQASFDPPGLTVSVKKDRSMEPLLQVGNEFVISMVPEGADRTVMRRLARPFAPDEDRLAGLETAPAPLTGAALLKDANAYMECKVVSRMEAGDHYVVYATIMGGDVLSDKVNTAVHHRKVANHY